MKALEVWINGERKCVAGTNDNVLCAIVNAMSEPDIRVGGITRKSGTTSHADWLNHALEIGDEVRIRLVETDEVDPPQTEKRFTSQAEDDEEMRTRLLNVGSMLPIQTSESGNAAVALFEQRMEEQNYLAALHILAELGEQNRVPAIYWRSLSWAAHRLGRYDEAREYNSREDSSPPTGENTS